MNGIAQTGRRLTEAELLRLFANELALHEPSEPLAHALVEQLPYLQQMIDDFAQQNGLVGAGLVDLEGRSLLLSSGAPPLPYNPLALLDQKTERWVSPVRSGDLDDAVILGARLLIDVALPVPVGQPWLAGEAPRDRRRVLHGGARGGAAGEPVGCQAAARARRALPPDSVE